MAGLTAFTAGAPAYAAPGDATIKIRVIQDYNGNGSWDDAFIEPGLADVDVEVTDEAGATQTLRTDSDGLVTLVGAPGSYRVVAQNPDPEVLLPAPAQKKTGTAETPSAQRLSSNEEFVTVAANRTVEMTTGFWDIRDYCQSNPLIVNACQPPIFSPSGSLADNATADTIFTAPYRGHGTNSGLTVLSKKADTGSVYGIGYQRDDRRIFAAAFAKRGVAYGPDGPGAIYTVSADGGPTTLWGTVPNVGSRPHSLDTAGLRQDWDFAPAVGKESLGDLDISEDGKDLQVLNLFTRELYVYDARTTTMGTPTHVVDLSGNPEDICAAGSDWRPGALAERHGVLYVGGVCTAESSQDPADMRAVILTLDADDYTPTGVVMDQTINRKRQSNVNGSFRCDPRDSAGGVVSTSFRPWNDEGIVCTVKNGRISDPQAWMDDIVVENNGDLIIAFRDRTGDQQLGVTSRYYKNTDGTGALVGIVDYVVAGDVNKACRNEDELTLDINGACGIAAPLPGQRSGKFFNGDGGIHNEEAYGGLALSRGERGVATSAMDPAGAIFTQGYFRMDRGTGRPLRAANGGVGRDPQEALQSPGGNTGGNTLTGGSSFSKGQGMADMEVLCDFAPIQIGNRVWDDRNGDGIQDAGEAGIAGVTVNLYEADGVTLVATAVTNSRGEYYFDSIDDGVDFNTDYVIRIDKPSDHTGTGKLSGLNLSPEDAGSGADQDRLDSDGVIAAGYPQASITTGNRGENDHTIDFGFSPAAVSVGNFVWVDSDGDGIQDPGEPGIPGVQLTLTGPGGGPVIDVNGDPVGPVTTDANGHYRFDNLPVLDQGESYTVHIDNAQSALSPYLPTQTGQGGDPAQDSSNGSASSGELTNPGDRDLTLDFGFIPRPVAVGDLVWLDSNGDGIQDPGEPGIPGVVLTITGPDGNPVTDIDGDPVGPVTTDANGHYVFTDLPVLKPGESYTVHVDNAQPALSQHVPTQPGQGGDTGRDSSTGSAQSGPLTTPDAQDLSLDFGFVPARVSVGDFVWLDSDRDGIQDAGESGIEGVVLVLTGPDGGPVTDVHGNPVGPVPTDADGRYFFGDLPTLPAGQHYTVSIDRDANSTVAALSGLHPTRSGQGTPGTDSSTWSAESGDLTRNGDRDLTLDFGFTKPAVSVGDLVWEDLDKNGVQDAGEPGIPGVVLVLTGPDGGPVTDVDGDPVGPVTTDADGRYSFDNLPALPAGYSYTVAIDRTASAEVLAFYVPSPAGAGEDRGADSSTWTAESADLTEDGDIDATLDFGFFRPKVAVGDYVWLDTNHDGVQDAGEPGIQGVVLKLTGPNGAPVTDVYGNPVGPVRTDANGAYSFENLPALPAGQHYTVTLDASASGPALAGLAPTLTARGTGGTDSSTGSATSGDLTQDGDRDMTLDFGFYTLPGVSVGDLVWFDKNKDGIQEAGEPGIPGVVLVLRGPDGKPVTDINGVPLGPVTTGPDGRYSFANLPPLPAGHSYTVAIDRAASATALAPYLPTKSGAGTPSTDSSTWSANTGDLTIDGESDLTLDFGFVLRSEATLTTKAVKKVVAKVGADGRLKPVSLRDAVTIKNLDGTGDGVARLYGPVTKRSEQMCTPGNLAGTVRFTARNGTRRTPAVKVTEPGVYTWLVTVKTEDGTELSHKCGLARETTTVQRPAYGPIAIETGRTDNPGAGFTKSVDLFSAPAMGTSNAPVHTVGLAKRRMVIPTGAREIGWLSRSASFGERIGSTVIAAHVSDRSDRPMAFWNLPRLTKGKVVTIKRGGKTYRYRVTSTAKFSRDKGPGIPKRYFKTTGKHRLVLVTCTDKVTYENGRFHYTNNLVVTAKPIK